MVYNTTQHPPPNPPSQPHTVCMYCTFSLGRGKGEGGGEVREKVERQQYTGVVLSSFTSWVENTSHE
jgi:hypothetical protein